MVIRAAKPEDAAALAKLLHALWPDATAQEHAQELESILAGRAMGILPLTLLVAEAQSLVGFAGVGLRSCADGCDRSRPVGYLEGWYVVPEWRGKGVGRSLLAAAEDWAREQGCHEMASDTWIDNLDSQRAHEALGFEVVDRCVNYRKRL